MLVTRLRVAGTPRAITNANRVPLISEGRRCGVEEGGQEWAVPVFYVFYFDLDLETKPYSKP